MSRVCVFFAEGFEEVEALTVVDLLRRAEIQVDMVSVSGSVEVTGRTDITVKADCLFEDSAADTADMLILPGGLPGVTNLLSYEPLTELLKAYAQDGKQIAAICAAPTILGALGILQGRHATCYPGVEQQLTGAMPETDAVVIDGNITTSRGVGTAIDFALALIEELVNEDTAKQIAESIVYTLAE